MKSVRVIARLDVKGPNVVKGVQFEALRVIGKPGDIARMYYEQGADEILYLDIVASLYRRENLLDIVREATKSIFIPFTAGGGVRSIDDIHALLLAGAEKVAINTAATQRPEILKEAAERFGSQCVVLSIEAKRTKEASWEAYCDNGRQRTGLDVIEWARRAEDLGAGEILLTSVDREGTRKGLDRELIRAVTESVSIPVIASGGAQSAQEVAHALSETQADAVAAASLLHYGGASISQIKDQIAAARIGVRPPTNEQRAYNEAPTSETDVSSYNTFTLRQFDHASVDGAAPQEMDIVSAQDADVVVIDYGINNVKSVVRALERIGKSVAIAKEGIDILSARRLILPGVGAFSDGMRALEEKDFVEPIKTAIEKGVPFLGICLGMQLLFSESEEFGHHKGLDVIKGAVVALPAPSEKSDFTVPHIGWEGIEEPEVRRWDGSILQHSKGHMVYFVHSFYAVPEDPGDILANTSYAGKNFCAAIQKGSISATQFHLEKSGEAGIEMLKAFCEQ